MVALKWARLPAETVIEAGPERMAALAGNTRKTMGELVTEPTRLATWTW